MKVQGAGHRRWPFRGRGPSAIVLLPGMSGRLRLRPTKERSIVIVDGDPEFSDTLRGMLKVRSFAVTQISDPHEVLETLGPEGGCCWT